MYVTEGGPLHNKPTKRFVVRAVTETPWDNSHELTIFIDQLQKKGQQMRNKDLQFQYQLAAGEVAGANCYLSFYKVDLI